MTIGLCSIHCRRRLLGIQTESTPKRKKTIPQDSSSREQTTLNFSYSEHPRRETKYDYDGDLNGK